MNELDQSEVAYESGPKEVAEKKGMPSSGRQFGKGNKMPQGNKDAKGGEYVERSYAANPQKSGRFEEYR